MDIGRTVLQNYLPRHRLDAGTFGTMGVGLGFAIAAALVAKDRNPGQRVICVEGDSAFGFSGMEVETICRYNLPIVILVVNNNGIYQGFDADTWKEMLEFQDATVQAPQCVSCQTPLRAGHDCIWRQRVFCTNTRRTPEIPEAGPGRHN